MPYPVKMLPHRADWSIPKHWNHLVAAFAGFSTGCLVPIQTVLVSRYAIRAILPSRWMIVNNAPQRQSTPDLRYCPFPRTTMWICRPALDVTMPRYGVGHGGGSTMVARV